MISPEPTFRALLLRSARLFSDEINLILQPHQLNYSLWQVMYVISRHPDCTSIEIAHYLNVSKPSIAKRIHTLQQLGLVSLQEATDRREKKLRLSDHGEVLYTTCSVSIQQLENSLLTHLTSQQVENSKASFEILIQALLSLKADSP